MSPEQIQGHETDHRSDIFSLGVLLFEMMTGQLPFKGMHETAMAYEIVNVDSPPPSSIRSDIPPELDAIVLECLEKDPKERTQSANQVAVDLKRYRRESSRSRASRITAARPATSRISTEQDGPPRDGRDPSSTTPRFRRWLPLALVAVAALLFGVAGTIALRPSTPAAGLIWTSVEMPRGVEYVSGLGGHAAISPDGTMIVFAAIDSQFQRMLWVRPLNMPEAHMLGGTKDAEYPFWSYDSRSIGFFAEGKLRVIKASGGPVLSLANAPLGRGGAWGSSGIIVFSPSVSDPNLSAVPAAGGAPTIVAHLDSSKGIAPRFPSFLPDGKHFVFTSVELGGRGLNTVTSIGSVDGAAPIEIANGWSNAIYASEHLVYLRQGILMAQPFDPNSRTLEGDAVTIQEGLNAWGPRAKGDFSLSENGLLLSSVGRGQSQEELIWIASNGELQPIIRTATFGGARLSPDGTRFAYDEIEGQSQRVDIWVYDLIRHVKTRLTFGGFSSSRPVWSRDGSRIYFSSEIGTSKANIVQKRADGTGRETVVLSGPDPNATLRPVDVTSDGRTLLAVSILGNQGVIGTIDVSDPERSAEFRPLGFRAESGRFSPDGRWIVYQSDESGKREVYVRSVQGADGQWQLSSGAGEEPIWTSSHIVYFSSAVDTYMKVRVTFAGGRPSFDQAEPLFPPATNRLASLYDASRDGRRFLSSRRIADQSSRSLSLVSNWTQLIKK
jgi:Tol biopolymer transport system component